MVLIGSAGYVLFGDVGIMQVGSSFIRPPRRGPAGPSAPSLARGFRGCAFCYSFNFFSSFLLCNFQCSVVGFLLFQVPLFYFGLD